MTAIRKIPNRSLTVKRVNQRPGYIPELQRAKYRGVNHPPFGEQKRIAKKGTQ